MLIRGFREKNETEYIAAYNDCIAAAGREDYYSAEEKCIDFLNKYGSAGTDDPSITAGICGTVGMIYYNTQRYDTSADYYLEAADMLDGTDESSDRFIYYTMAARCYSKTGEYGKAIEALSALEISEIPDGDKGLLYLYKADVYRKEGDDENAEKCVGTALDLVDRSRLSDTDLEVLEELKNIYGL